MLDEKIECSECHRVFFAKSTAGKRVAAPDHTKAYIGFGVSAVVIIALFALSGKKAPTPKPKPKRTIVERVFSLSDHPRANGLTSWAQSIGGNNPLVLSTHTDLEAMAAFLNLESSESAAVMSALQKDKATELFRQMRCSSARLNAPGDMTAASGSGLIFVTPKPGDDTFKKNTRGEFTVTFNADGDSIKVTSFKLKMPPIYGPGKNPNIKRFVGNADIAKPEAVQITDSAGTRKVAESQPSALAHWKNATPEQRAMADEVVAGILAAAVPDAPGYLFNRATIKVRTKDEKKAAIPRVLNAMFEAYGDVMSNHQKLILLDRAIYQWTGFAVNYPSAPTGNNEVDQKRRQSCVRQWFGFWYRYYNNLDEFFDSRENLEDEDDDGK